ncbi:hypothetical protein [Streptomyces sp. NPDC007100]|uniref:hypothetical protein n=1 Tax=Streptomyces sp. NPDC007100 TaxID=3155602 RepID=UPI0033D5D8E7
MTAARNTAAVPRPGRAAAEERFAEILGALDTDFLDVLGWDWERRVLTYPREHPVLGLPDCPVPNCTLAITVATLPMCRGCMERWSKSGVALEEFLLIPKGVSRGGRAASVCGRAV